MAANVIITALWCKLVVDTHDYSGVVCVLVNVKSVLGNRQVPTQTLCTGVAGVTMNTHGSAKEGHRFPMNQLVCTAILFSGSLPGKALRMFSFLRLAVRASRTLKH